MARGGAKYNPGKFKTKRGGGRSFSKHMVLDENGTAMPDQKWRDKGEESSSESGSEEESSEESEEESDDAPQSSSVAQPDMDRAQRKAMKKKQPATQGDESEEDEDLINPNHVQKKLDIKDLDAPRQLTRREKEQKEKKDAQDRYWKLHVQGKTDEAKSDLARLAKIRAEREASAAKRKAETEAKATELEAKKKAQLERRS